MKARHSLHSVNADRNRPNFKAAATFLGIYTALYLAVAGLVHSMTSPEAAAAIVPQSTPASVAAATMPAETTAAAVGVIATALAHPATDEPDNSRECQLDAGVDSACIFN